MLKCTCTYTLNEKGGIYKIQMIDQFHLYLFLNSYLCVLCITLEECWSKVLMIKIE